MTAKTITIDDLITEQLKNPEVNAGFELESERLDYAVRLMLSYEAEDSSQ